MAIQEIVDRVAEEIPGFEALLAGGFDGSVLGSHSTGGLDLAAQAAEIATMARAYHQAYEGLGGIITMGGNDEVLVKTTRHYILIRPHHGSGRYLAIAIASSGNVGYLRLKMKRYLDEIVRG